MYHVMGAATGERVVKDDDERRTFVGTLGEACERADFRIHASVLMSNHYHLLLGDARSQPGEGA
jgi:putative transposase